jgi:hypothetical protein
MAEGATFSRKKSLFYYLRLPSCIWQFLLGLLFAGLGLTFMDNYSPDRT